MLTMAGEKSRIMEVKKILEQSKKFTNDIPKNLSVNNSAT
jgi:hypothetical protein